MSGRGVDFALTRENDIRVHPSQRLIDPGPLIVPDVLESLGLDQKHGDTSRSQNSRREVDVEPQRKWH